TDNSVKRYSSLQDLTDQVVKDLADQLRVSEPAAKRKKQDLVDYCESRGKKYKNYLATLRNWIRKDIECGKLNKIQPTVKHDLPQVEDRLSPEQWDELKRAKMMIGGVK